MKPKTPAHSPSENGDNGEGSCVEAPTGQSETTLLHSTQKKTGSSIQKKKQGKGERSVRCEQCCKKIGVACRYSCRCGKVFCTSHRYAETHGCTFDYKAEGRRIIREENPLICPTKIKKI